MSDWTEIAERRTRTAKCYRNVNDDRRFAVDAVLATVHDVDPAEIDMTPQRVNNATADGWLVSAADWHYFVGKPKSGTFANVDGVVGFGGRRGANWLRFRLQRVGYLHWADRAWQDIGGAPNYLRTNLTSNSSDLLGVHGETVSRWTNVWSTPGGGSLDVSWRSSGDGLKEEITINQAARSWIAANRPPSTAAGQTWFSFVFQVDWSDIPRLYRSGVLQSVENDITGDDPLELRDATDHLLALLPVGSGWVRGHEDAPFALQRRLYKDGADYYMLIGVRCDVLAALPDGDLVFDPTLDYTVNAGANDAWWDTSAINTGAAGFRLGTSGGVYRSSFARWSVTIPAGATIDTAHVTLTDWWNESTSASVTTTIAGHDADNPAALTTQAGCVSATRTTATVSFVWSSGTAQTTDTEHTTPELKTIIQELVNSYDFSGGAALTLLFDYASSSADRQLVFDAYDDSTTKAPKLHIEYSTTVSVAKSDAATVAEAVSLAPQTQVAKSDAVTVGEAVSVLRSVAAIAKTDTATVGESVSLSVSTAQITVTDSATVGESVALAVTQLDRSLSVSDSATIGESLAVTVSTPAITASDSATVGESASVVVVHVFEARVATNTDDGFWYSNFSNFATGPGNLAIGMNGAGGLIVGFMRWQVTLPYQAIILAARITLTGWTNESTAASITTSLMAHDAEDPAAPASNAEGNATPRTTANAEWIWPSGDATTDGSTHNTADFTAVIQELVDSYNYSAGAALTMLMETVSASAVRIIIFDSYDDAPSTAALLHIEYADSGLLAISAADSVTVAESAILNPQSQISVADSAAVSEAISLHELSYIAVTDSATVGEAIDLLELSHVAATDATTVAESATLQPLTQIVTADASTVADAATAIVTDPQIAAADSATVAESVNLHELSYISVADASTVAESVNLHELSYISVADASTVAESIAVDAVYFITATDSATVSETVGLLELSHVATADAATIGEAIAVAVSEPAIIVANSATLGESVAIIRELVDVRQLSTSDAVAVAESHAVTVSDPQIATADSATASDSAILNSQSEIATADASTVADAATLAVSEPAIVTADASTVADSAILNPQSTIAVSDASTVAESITVSVSVLQISVTDGVTVTDLCVVTVSVALIAVTDASTVADSAILNSQSEIATADASTVADAATLAVSEPAIVTADASTVAESVTGYPAQLLLQSADAISVGDTIAMFVIVLHGLVDVTLTDSAAYRAILADSALYSAVVTDRTRTEGIG